MANMIDIRRIFTHVESIAHEFGPPPAQPLVRGANRRKACDHCLGDGFLELAVSRGGEFGFEGRPDRLARLPGTNAELSDLIDRERRRDALERARHLLRQRDRAKWRRLQTPAPLAARQLLSSQHRPARGSRPTEKPADFSRPKPTLDRRPDPTCHRYLHR